jgi:hypothetical protein
LLFLCLVQMWGGEIKPFDICNEGTFTCSKYFYLYYKIVFSCCISLI